MALITHNPGRPSASRRQVWSQRYESWTPILVLLAIIVVANLPALLGGVITDPLVLQSNLATNVVPGSLPGQPSIDPNDGFTLQALGHLAASDWVHGTVPWWNPYEGLGAPLAGEMQAAALFPPVLLELLKGGVLYFHLLLEAVAGVATYLLLRRLGVTQLGALVGGVAFGLNGTFAWLGNAAATPVAFLPAMLLGVEMIHENGLAVRRRGLLVLAAALALSIYAGFPETAAIDAVLVLVWALLRLPTVPPPERRRYLTSGGWAVVVGVLLAAPLMDAFVTYLPFANVGGNAGMYGSDFLPSTGVAMLAMPYVFGPIFGFYANDPSGILGSLWGSVGGFTTAGLIALASMAVWSSALGRYQRWLRLGLATWVVVAWAKTFGLPGINFLIAHLPGFAGVAFYRYSAPSWELALVVLAALGLDDIRKRKVGKLVPLLATSCTVAFLGVGAVAGARELGRISDAPHIHLYAAASIGAALAVVCAMGLLVAFVDSRAPGEGLAPAHWVAAITIAEVMVLFAIPQLSAPRGGSVDLAPVRYLERHLGNQRFATLGPLSPNYGSYFGIAEINANDLPMPRRFTDFVTSNLDRNVDPLIFTGTTSLSSSGTSPILAFTQNLREYEGASVKFVLVAPGSAGARSLVAAGLKLVFADVAVQIYRLPHAAAFEAVSGSDCHLMRGQLDVAVVECNHTGVLLRRELYMVGWTATENGRPVHISPYDSVFQSVFVAAGETKVVFSFAPPGLAEADVALGLGLSVLLLGLVSEVARGRRRP